MRKITNLDDNWYITTKYYKKAPKKISDDFNEITIPHLQKSEEDFWCCNFCKVMPNKGEKVYLAFHGVAGNTTVFINSKKCAYHSSSFTAFLIDITDYVKHKKVNIAIKISPCNDAALNCFYGIFRPVRLVTVQKEHFDVDFYASSGISVKSVVNDDGSADVMVQTFVSGKADNCQVVFDFEGKQQVQSAKNPVASYHIGSPHLWQGVNDPFLYSATASLVSDGEVLDKVSTKFGIRSYFVDENKGFFLNNKPYRIFGACTSPFKNGIEGLCPVGSDDMDIIKKALEIGINAIRTPHYVQSEHFFNICDEYGIIVFPEIDIPSDIEKRDDLLYQVRENVYQKYNHPSLCFWSFYSQDDSDTHKELLNSADALCRMLDQSRLTVLTQPIKLLDRGALSGITNLISCTFDNGDNDFNNHLDLIYKKSSDVSIGIASFGCAGSEKYHSTIPVQGDMTEEYQSLYYEMLLSSLELRPYVWCNFASCLIGEFGLYSSTLDKKDSAFIIQSYFTEEPFVHLCSARFKKRMVNDISVRIYSNRKKVGLSIGGNEIATLTGNNVFVFNNVKLLQGENVLCAFAEDCVDDYAVLTTVDDDFNEYSINGGNVQYVL